jgi:hypothetical protein
VRTQEGGLLAGCWSTSRQTRCWCACCLCLHLVGDLALFLSCPQCCWLSFIGSGRLRDAFPSDSFFSSLSFLFFCWLAPSQIFTSLFFMTLSWHGRQQGNSRFCGTGRKREKKRKEGKRKEKKPHIHSELFALQMPLLKY